MKTAATATTTAHVETVRAAYHGLTRQMRIVTIAAVREETGLLRADFEAAIRQLLQGEPRYQVAPMMKPLVTPGIQAGGLDYGNERNHQMFTCW